MLVFEFLKNIDFQRGYDAFLRHPTDNIVTLCHTLLSIKLGEDRESARYFEQIPKINSHTNYRIL